MTLRKEVERRARSRREYCHSQTRFSTQTFALEHITPRSLGGLTVLENLALACQECNNHKYNRTQSARPRRTGSWDRRNLQTALDHFTAMAGAITQKTMPRRGNDR